MRADYITAKEFIERIAYKIPAEMLPNSQRRGVDVVEVHIEDLHKGAKLIYEFKIRTFKVPKRVEINGMKFNLENMEFPIISNCVYIYINGRKLESHKRSWTTPFFLLEPADMMIDERLAKLSYEE